MLFDIDALKPHGLDLMNGVACFEAFDVDKVGHIASGKISVT
jgi:hypothetical protein